MRKPNGYGSLKKLSGNRRRPYVFVVTENGKQRPVSYFETQIEGEIFQADYNRQHHRTLPGHKITFLELYYRWLPVHIDRNNPSKSAINGYSAALSRCSSIHHMPIADIKYRHLQSVIDAMRKGRLSYSSCKKVRSLISLMYKYAQTMEYTDRSFNGLLHLGKNKAVRPHHPFTRQKINRLWSHVEEANVDTVLILIYTGMRVGELLNLKKADVNRRQKYVFVRQSKTESGVRIIPIHPKIYPLIVRRMNEPGEFLIGPYTYSQYVVLWKQVMKLIHGEKHTTHDCRHTLATLLSNADVNEVAKKRILGHADGNVTDAVYTHKNLHQLRKAIEKIQ